MIDLTPEALQNRMRRGDVYPQERVGRALGNFFRETNLIALRELALRQVAQQVDLSLEQHRGEEKKIGHRLPSANALPCASVRIRRRSI